jgi:hypothetical protein
VGNSPLITLASSPQLKLLPTIPGKAEPVLCEGNASGHPHLKDVTDASHWLCSVGFLVADAGFGISVLDSD